MWSFDAMKILVCGDGGMLHFNDPELRARRRHNNFVALFNVAKMHGRKQSLATAIGTKHFIFPSEKELLAGDVEMDDELKILLNNIKGDVNND